MAEFKIKLPDGWADKPFYTVQEIAATVGLSACKVYRCTENPAAPDYLPSYKFNGAVRVDREQVRAWLYKCRNAA
jgi:excisionase family DNA binding protein